jgi:hypothetical protein
MNDNALILKKLERIEALLEALTKPKARETAASRPLRFGGEALLKTRVAELERVFIRLASATRLQRLERYKFPRYLVERPGQAPLEAVLASVLINQASIRKIFRPVSAEGESDKTPAQIAKETLAESTLLVVPAHKTTLESDSQALVALSPAGALASVSDRSLLPSVWRGWTCDERVSPAESGVGVAVRPLVDPCAVESKEPKEPQKKILKIKLTASQPSE